MSFPRIFHTGAFRADGTRLKHACQREESTRSLCGVGGYARFGEVGESIEFLLGDPANCPKCEKVVREKG